MLDIYKLLTHLICDNVSKTKIKSLNCRKLVMQILLCLGNVLELAEKNWL
jgi:hypothetical protein